jgi:hypothetical protein
MEPPANSKWKSIAYHNIGPAGAEAIDARQDASQGVMSKKLQNYLENLSM